VVLVEALEFDLEVPSDNRLLVDLTLCLVVREKAKKRDQRERRKEKMG